MWTRHAMWWTSWRLMAADTKDWYLAHISGQWVWERCTHTALQRNLSRDSQTRWTPWRSSCQALCRITSLIWIVSYIKTADRTTMNLRKWHLPRWTNILTVGKNVRRCTISSWAYLSACQRRGLSLIRVYFHGMPNIWTDPQSSWDLRSVQVLSGMRTRSLT